MYILSSTIVFFTFIFNAISSLFVFYICKYKAREVDIFFSFFISIFYIIIIFTRSGFGVDEPTYRLAYENYLVNPLNFEFEYSFELLYFLFKNLGINAEGFNNSIGFIYIALAWAAVFFSIKSPFRSMCLLFLLFNSVFLDFIFNGYRQGLAFLVFIIAVSLYQKRHVIKSIVFFFFSLGFHWSAAIVIAIFFTSRLTLGIKIKWALYVVMVLNIYIFSVEPAFISVMAKSISSLSLSSDISQKIEFYLMSSKFTIYDMGIIGRMILLLIPSLALILFVVYFYEYIPKIWVNLVVFISFYCIALIEMSYSYRNFYWLIPMAPFIIGVTLDNLIKAGVNISGFVFMFCVIHIALSVMVFYSSPIIPLVFLH